jgi:hypothetical protein
LTREGLFPTTPTRSTLLGGISWIVSLSYFVGQAIAQLAWKGPPSYSMISDPVSDLGVTVCGTVKIGGLSGYYCSPLYLAEDAGFVITGVAIFLGVCLTRGVWPRSRSSNAGLVLLALAGAGKVAAGLSAANVDLTIHLLDVPGIVLGNIGMIMVGRALRAEARRVARFTEALGVIGLIGILGFLAGSHSGVGGLLERIGGYPLIVWAAIIGIVLLHASPTRSGQRATNGLGSSGGGPGRARSNNQEDPIWSWVDFPGDVAIFWPCSSISMSFSGNIIVSVVMSTLEFAIPACDSAHSENLRMSEVFDALSTTEPVSGSAKLPVR